jgi:hypothetical protein
MAMIFGNQNGPGQFHKNCYTIPKIRAILRHLGLEEVEISTYRWKGKRDLMIRVRARKPLETEGADGSLSSEQSGVQGRTRG